MRKPKKPTSATVTAAIAAIRAAPSDLRNSTSPCTAIRPGGVRPGKNCLLDGYQRVKKPARNIPDRENGQPDMMATLKVTHRQ